MKQTGVVSEVNGRMATVCGDRASACGSCAGKSSCSTLGSWNAKQASLKAWNDIGARVGDTVEIEVPDGVVLRSAFRLYGLPMLLFFATGAIAYLVVGAGGGNGDLWAALTGMVSVVVYYLSGAIRGREEAGLEARIVRVQTQPPGDGLISCRIEE